MHTPSETASNVTQLPRGGRDGFIADTAIRLERLESAAARLQQDSEQAHAAVLSLMDSHEQAQRLRSFDESLRNAREYKIDEILRTTRDLKGRLDRFEGDRATFAALPHTSFEAVNKRLQELGRLETEIKTCETRVKTNSHLFLATMLVLAATLAAYFLPAIGLT